MAARPVPCLSATDDRLEAWAERVAIVLFCSGREMTEPAEVLARAQRLERSEPIYIDGPLPERGLD